MLKNIDPLLGPELLSLLRAMGHGEEIAVVDRNYPTLSAGTRVVRLDGSDAPRTLEALLSVLPLDPGKEAVTRMQARDRPDELLPVMRDMLDVVLRSAPDAAIHSLSADDFKVRASHAAGIVITGEVRGYGNIILRKGSLKA